MSGTVIPRFVGPATLWDWSVKPKVLISSTWPSGVVEVHDQQRYSADYPTAVIVSCGGCGRAWDDAVATSWTPAPSGRCPFEYDHVHEHPADCQPGPELLGVQVAAVTGLIEPYLGLPDSSEIGVLARRVRDVLAGVHIVNTPN